MQKTTDRYFQRPRHWLSTLYSYRLCCKRHPCPSTTVWIVVVDVFQLYIESKKENKRERKENVIS